MTTTGKDSQNDDFIMSKSENNSSEINGNLTLSSKSTETRAHPVDKGWAWVIMIGAFGMHFLSIGYLRSFGILFVEFQNKYGSSSTMTSLVSGVQCGAYSISTLFVVHVLMKRLSIRTICIVGSVFEAVGIALNGCVPDVPYLVITQGFIFGCGQALLYCPTVVILSEYFDRRRPIATVISTCGVSAGGMTFPPVTRYLVDKFGLQGGLLLLAALVLQQTILSSLFTPTSDYYFASTKTKLSFVEVQNVTMLDKDLDPNSEFKINQNSVQRENSLDKSLNLHEISISECQQCPKTNKGHNFEYDARCASSLPAPTYLSKALDETRSHLLENNDQAGDHSCPIHSATDLATEMHTKGKHGHFHKKNGIGYILSKSLTEMSPSSDATIKPTLEGNQNTSSTASTRNDLLVAHSHHSNKPSLKETMMTALSASTVDLFGSVHSVALQGVPPTVSEPRFRQSQGMQTHTESENSNIPKRRWQCKAPQLMKSVSFWIVAVFFASGGIGSALPVIFIPPLANEKGLNEYAALFLMVSALTEMMGRLIPGMILHFDLMRPSTVVIGPMAACATLFQCTHFFDSFGTFLSFSVMIGLFSGAFWAMQSLVVIEVFGFERLGPALGFYSIVVGFSIGTSYPVAGSLRDVSGTYESSFHYFGVMYYIAALMMIIVQFTTSDNDIDLDVTSDEENESLPSYSSDEL